MIINTQEERYEYPLTTGSPPSPREDFGMALVGSKIIIYGGFNESGALNDLYRIDMLNLTWNKVQTGGSTPSPKRGVESTRVGNRIYITGGCDYSQQICFTDTFYLDTDSFIWTKLGDK